MNYILLYIIRIYWVLIPESKRRKCIFRETCSKHVFKVTKDQGLIRGVKALVFRIKNCQSEFDVYTDPITKQKKMVLKSGQIVSENQIAERLK